MQASRSSDRVPASKSVANTVGLKFSRVAAKRQSSSERSSSVAKVTMLGPMLHTITSAMTRLLGILSP
jgi:hypothetical protein